MVQRRDDLAKVKARYKHRFFYCQVQGLSSNNMMGPIVIGESVTQLTKWMKPHWALYMQGLFEEGSILMTLKARNLRAMGKRPQFILEANG